jgi:hypothetical protein
MNRNNHIFIQSKELVDVIVCHDTRSTVIGEVHNNC